MDLYDVAVARKLSSGGGGSGGSSDFSTATVTIVNNATGKTFDAIFPYIEDDYMYSSTSDGWVAGDKEVVLYKGTCEFNIIPQGANLVSVAVSGNIEKDGGFAIIHGAGTITLT